ncbi:evolutionarily conserved signaling intermediate in Toll pathway, mitochondrial [Bombina bombina]|uniref:evolutionarily conserved signaling intermediate in Toll pathway, mitochondrial n=1 Tax=Bombina bombina TaxID=8345 RepID=UPI00235AA811|nr:evolutionarily conserved signaling intermediate in Toll pathway, mitochondrial [Bombina bombina]
MRRLHSLFTAGQLYVWGRNIPEAYKTSVVVQVTKPLHTSPPPGPPQASSSSQRSVLTYEDVFTQEERTKSSFVQVLKLFCNNDVRRRGHVEMIEVALKWMPEFGVEKDLEVYNQLLDIFPKEVFVAQNFIQRMFHHFPRQQECAIRVLEQMENYGVMPNSQTRFLLLQIFGERSHPIRKYQRLMYWFPRFKHTNPFPVPADITDPVDLAKVCLQRIAADRDARVTVYHMSPEEECESGNQEHRHLVGIQSPDQMSSLAAHDPSVPVIVEGPFPLWLRKTCVYYYILRADPLPQKQEEEVDPERCFYYPLSLDLELERDLGDEETFDIDDVEEGPVFAMCMAGSGDERTLGKWIRSLQETNPILAQTPVLFRLNSGPQELISSEERETESKPKEQKQEEQFEEEDQEPVNRRMGQKQ